MIPDLAIEAAARQAAQADSKYWDELEPYQQATLTARAERMLRAAAPMLAAPIREAVLREPIEAGTVEVIRQVVDHLRQQARIAILGHNPDLAGAITKTADALAGGSLTNGARS